MGLGVPELLIVAAIILLLFGVGRIDKLSSELGRGIRSFRENLKDDHQSAESK